MYTEYTTTISTSLVVVLIYIQYLQYTVHSVMLSRWPLIGWYACTHTHARHQINAATHPSGLVALDLHCQVGQQARKGAVHICADSLRIHITSDYHVKAADGRAFVERPEALIGDA